MSDRLKGKRAFVTAAAVGIGRACALAFAREVERRPDEVPAGEVWVHCASGFRASIAASLLDRAGRQVVHVDDDWERAERLGLPLTTDG